MTWVSALVLYANRFNNRLWSAVNCLYLVVTSRFVTVGGTFVAIGLDRRSHWGRSDDVRCVGRRGDRWSNQIRIGNIRNDLLDRGVILGHWNLQLRVHLYRVVQGTGVWTIFVHNLWSVFDLDTTVTGGLSGKGRMRSGRFHREHNRGSAVLWSYSGFHRLQRLRISIQYWHVQQFVEAFQLSSGSFADECRKSSNATSGFLVAFVRMR